MTRTNAGAADAEQRDHAGLATARLFAGAGEMRERCRAFDWAATPLGPVEAWSPALCAAVRLCLDAGFATCLYVGDDLVLVYNDRFVEALGRKHPRALGRPAREVWAEIWAQSAPDFERVRATGAAVFHHDQRFLLDRGADGAPEEAFYTFAFSPVRDEGGAVVGVLSTVVETTAQILAERQREAARQALAAERAAAVAVLEDQARARERTNQQLQEQAAEQQARAEALRAANEEWERAHGALRAAERQARFLAELGQALQPLTDPDEVMATAARLLGEHVEADRCAYAEVEADEDHFTITGNYTRGDTASILGRFAFTDFGAAVLRLMREDRPYVVDDAADDSRVTPPDRVAYEQTQIRAVICVPLHKAGRLVAAMAVHQRAPRRWSPEEVALVVTVVQRCWESLERARALRRLQEREAALAASERQFRTLADAIPTLAWTAKPDGHIDWYNARWYEYTGTTAEEMAGWGWQSVHDPAELPWILDRWRRGIATGEPVEMTFPLRGADGRYRPFLTRIVPLRDGDGRVVRWFGTNTDVSPERTAREAAEAANRAKSEFLAVMSHELRTPLNAIGGYAELMEMGIRGPVTDQQREDLVRIQRSQRHLLGLVNDVLNYAKLETGSVRYDVADVVLREALAGAEGLVAPQARARGLTLAAAECPAELAARADAEKLRQVLVNLLSNAVKFTEPGGRIAMVCAADVTHVRIAVQDTGIGIAADQLERIFEPFVQVRADLTRPHEGTGLGLAISRDLARGMGGDLTVESAPGVGSTFTLTLPRA